MIEAAAIRLQTTAKEIVAISRIDAVVGTAMVGTNSSGGSVQLTRMLIAVTAMFLQQTCGSIARALPAVLAPLIIADLHADAAWVGVYFSLTAFAGRYR